MYGKKPSDIKEKKIQYMGVYRILQNFNTVDRKRLWR